MLRIVYRRSLVVAKFRQAAGGGRGVQVLKDWWVLFLLVFSFEGDPVLVLAEI